MTPTPQQAYNKGLDDAENLAVVKFSNALLGTDDGSFNNPLMEDIRQKILSRDIQDPPTPNNYAASVLLGLPYNTDGFNSVDGITIEILEYAKLLSETKSVNKITVKLKQLISKLNAEICSSVDDRQSEI